MNKFKFVLPVILCSNLLFASQEHQEYVGCNLIGDNCSEGSIPKTVNRKNIESIFKISTSKKSIKSKKEKIEKDIKIGENVVYASIGVSSVIGLLLAYKFARYVFSEDIKIKKQVVLDNLDLTEKVLKLENVKDPKFLSQKWLKNFAENAAFNFFTSSLVGVCVNVFGDFYKRHSGFYNLADFMGSKTSSLMNFDLFLSDAEILSKIKLDNNSDNNLYYKDLRFRLVSRLRNIVSDLEGVIAFMEYKIDSINNIILKKEDILIPEYLFECLNDYCKHLEILPQDTLDEELYNRSLSFKNNFMNIINIFEGLEARIAWINSVS